MATGLDLGATQPSAAVIVDASAAVIADASAAVIVDGPHSCLLLLVDGLQYWSTTCLAECAVCRFGIAMYGPWVYDWKDAIDRVWFMESFSKDKLPDLSTVDVMAKAEQFDAAQHVATELAPSDPAEAAKVLMKQDITWPSNQVKQIVNLMVQDEAYRMNVVQAAFSC